MARAYHAWVNESHLRSEEELVRRQRAVRDSAGWALNRDLLAARRMIRVFRGNDRELTTFLDVQAEPERALALWTVGNPEFEPFLDEADRLLHNYLAAVAALRDHQRRLWQQHPPADPRAEAEYKRRTALFSDPLCMFVQDLRNYTHHRQLPVAQGSLHVDVQGGVVMAGVTIARERLVTWDNWRAESRTFLDAAPDAIPLRDVVGSYSRAVEQFGVWFVPAFVTAHRADFDELARLQRELERLYTAT